MLQVCYYKGCGIIYGEKEPLSDKRETHGLCPQHFNLYLEEIKAELEALNARERLKILIVEDSGLYREVFRSALRERFPDVEIHEAADGGDALRKIDEVHPNLVFMDIRLPGENGLEITRKIKTAYPEIMVVILTAYDLPEYQEIATQYRADYFFVKGSAATKSIFHLIDSILPYPHGNSSL